MPCGFVVLVWFGIVEAHHLIQVFQYISTQFAKEHNLPIQFQQTHFNTVSTNTFQHSFNKHISSTVSTHTFQVRFQQTHFKYSFNTHISIKLTQITKSQVPFINVLTEQMLGLKIPYVPFINRRHRSLVPSFQFLDPIQYYTNDKPVNRLRGWASGMWRSEKDHEWDVPIIRAMFSHLGNSMRGSDIAMMSAVILDFLRLNQVQNKKIEFQYVKIFNGQPVSTLQLAQSYAEADFGIMFPWDWELTTFLEWFGLNLPTLVPSAPWMVAQLRCTMFNTAGKWDMLRGEWKHRFLF